MTIAAKLSSKSLSIMKGILNGRINWSGREKIESMKLIIKDSVNP